MLSYLDRVNISLAKLPMAADFGLSEHAFSVGASIFFWGYMLCEIPSNLLLQRVGARVWIARIMVTWGIVSTLMVFSRSLPLFYGLRLLLGICEAGFVPGVLYYANTWLPVRRQSGMLALFLVALPTAEVIGAPVSGFIVEHMGGVGGLRGWQWLFLLEGLPTVVLGVVMYALLRNRPSDAEWLSPAERAVVERNVDGERGGKAHRFSDALRSPGVYLLIIIMILWNTSFYGLVFWLPTLVRNAGVLSSARVGLLTAIPFLVGGVAMVVFSRMAERLDRQRLFAAVAAAVAATGMLAARAFEGNLPLVLSALAVALAGVLTLIADLLDAAWKPVKRGGRRGGLSTDQLLR